MTSSVASMPLDFRRRFVARTDLFGTFVKTPSPHVIEILGSVGFDFVILDAEHAPFDRGVMDISLLAARGTGVAALVRVPEVNASHILAALDDGASGIVAPHITSAEEARNLVALCRYSGVRGFSNSPRAGGYGARGLWAHVDQSDSEVTVIAMIEDPEAVEAIDDIGAVDGVDGLFIGRADLAVAFNDRAPGAPRVAAATETVLRAAGAAGKAVCLLATSSDEVASLRAQGASAFVAASDQGFLRTAAQAALTAFQEACVSADGETSTD